MVLAGGRSRRYGADKSLVHVGGVAMVRLVADALVAAGIPSVIALGGDEAALRELGLSVLADHHPGEGPLGALVTAFAEITADVLVVAACDLPALDGTFVRSVLDELRRAPGAAAALARTDRLEPLGAAAYRVTACAGPFRAAFDRGERSLQHVLSGVPTVLVDADPAVLLNVNHPSDRPQPG